MIPTRNQIGTHVGAPLATPVPGVGRRKRRPYMPIRMQAGMKQTLHFFFALPVFVIAALALATATAIPLRADFTLTSTVAVNCELPASAVSGTAPTEAEWLNAAEKGNADLQAALGSYYLEGSFGLPKDNRKALEWLQKSADGGSAQGQYMLGVSYLSGKDGVAADVQKAISLFRGAGEQGFLPAQQALGFIYISNASGAANVDQAAYWYKKAAREHGDAAAKAQLFIFCLNGITSAENLAELVDWCRASAEAGTPVAQYFLFDACDTGKNGLPKDEADAKKWLDKAIAQNDVNVQLCLYARAVENRPGHPADAAEAVKWLLAIAENKNRQGALNPDYFQAIFTSSPPSAQTDAVNWLAAEAGQKRPWAQFFLGALYAHGLPNLPADENKAQELFREAAAAGLPAQQELVRMFGAGVSSIPRYYPGLAGQSFEPAAPRGDDAPAKARSTP